MAKKIFWSDLSVEEKKTVAEELKTLVLTGGRVAIDNEGGPPVIYDPRTNHPWEHSEWRSMDEEAIDTAAAQWFEKRGTWPS